ncbi:MAG: hypothetical protein WDK96_02680 [Candidatus Paceibacterota bacterium]|jgi:type II secretory pathway pseudopilin PulG
MKKFFIKKNKGFTQHQTSSKKKFGAGFTIIEALVSLTIFSFSIMGLLTITASGVTNTNYAKNRMQASYLAQEGIELVRTVRDTAIVNGQPWSDELYPTPCTVLDSSCKIAIDYNYDGVTGGKVVSCDLGNGCGPLNYDSQYIYGFTGTPSLYTRTITLEKVDGDNLEIKVTSEVTWLQGFFGTRTVSLTENLFDWTNVTP